MPPNLTLKNDPTKMRIESHCSQLNNFIVIEQLSMANTLQVVARRTLTFDNIRNYYTEVNALWNLVLPAIRNEKWYVRIAELMKSFEKEEIKIMAGIIPPTKIEMIVLYKTAELLQRTIQISLQELSFFYRIDWKEQKGLDVLQHFDTISIFKKFRAGIMQEGQDLLEKDGEPAPNVATESAYDEVEE